jgi:hypothetical protein
MIGTKIETSAIYSCNATSTAGDNEFIGISYRVPFFAEFLMNQNEKVSYQITKKYSNKSIILGFFKDKFIILKTSYKKFKVHNLIQKSLFSY